MADKITAKNNDAATHPVWVPVYDARAFVLSAIGAQAAEMFGQTGGEIGPVLANGKVYFGLNGHRYVVTIESDES